MKLLITYLHHSLRRAYFYDFLCFTEQELQSREEQRAAEEAMQLRLDHTSALLQKLQQVQSDRLSLTPPAHLSHVAQPSDSEVQLGESFYLNCIY